MKNVKITLIFFSLLCVFSSCFRNEDSDDVRRYGKLAKGLYVLCEGTGLDNNSALSYYNFADSSSMLNYFEDGLGKNANDMISVDNKLYIVVTESACVWVLDKDSGTRITRIGITDKEGNNRKPRHLTYHEGFVYVSCWDATVVKIDKNNNSIVGECSTQGRYPEGIAVAKNKLYVANSGGLDYPNYDKTVSVIDIKDFVFENKIEVEKNPQTLKVYKDKIYVLSTGNYMTTPVLTVINNGEKEKQISLNIVDFDFCNDRLYFFYRSPYADPKTNKDFNLSYLDINNLDSPAQILKKQTLPSMVMPYHITIIEKTLFVCDAKDFQNTGEVFALDLQGDLLYKFPTLINPSVVVAK